MMTVIIEALHVIVVLLNLLSLSIQTVMVC